MRQLKYLEKLEQFINVPLFTSAEAEKQGVPRQALAYLVKRGTLERIYPGAYRFSQYEPEVEFQWENLALIAVSIPDGVICLISALCYYDLTDQMMREVWIAVPHESYPPKRPNTRIIRMRNAELGKIEITLGEYNVRIFDRERSVVDAFRYLSKEIAIKAIQRYFQSSKYKPDPKKLGAYAKALRVNITPYILSCTT
jgi:predicted transcriptional regulator of viral defense system